MSKLKNIPSPTLGDVLWPYAWPAAIVSVGCAALMALIGWSIDGGFETTLLALGWLFTHLWMIILMVLKAVSLGGESFWFPAIAALTLFPLVAVMCWASIKLLQAKHNTISLRIQKLTFCPAVVCVIFSGGAICASHSTDNVSAYQSVVALVLVALLSVTSLLIVFGLPMLIDATHDRLRKQRLQYNEGNTWQGIRSLDRVDVRHHGFF